MKRSSPRILSTKSSIILLSLPRLYLSLTILRFGKHALGQKITSQILCIGSHDIHNLQRNNRLVGVDRSTSGIHWPPARLVSFRSWGLVQSYPRIRYFNTWCHRYMIRSGHQVVFSDSPRITSRRTNQVSALYIERNEEDLARTYFLVLRKQGWHRLQGCRTCNPGD